MTSDEFNKEQLLDLIGGLLDGWLDDPGREELARMLKAHPEARRIYHAQMDLHARLHLDYAGGLANEFMREIETRPRRRGFPARRLAWAAAAAAIAIGAFLAWPRSATQDAFATLEKSVATKWNSSDLPTTEGARLGKGTLRLSEGLATLRFDSGAKVTIEGPADLTLSDAMHCILAGGGVVAEIADSAKGFRITTPTAKVTDFGTRFSVEVDGRTGDTRTQVYEGHVEVEHQRSGKVASLKQGQVKLTNRDRFGEVTDLIDESDSASTIGPAPRGPDWTLLQTSKDAYVGRAYLTKVSPVVETHRSESLLLVKNGTVGRRAYLGFDLAGIDPERIKDAALALQFEPTGWGLASLVPDATFFVFGLISEEPWDERSIDKHAPASMNPSRGRRLQDYGAPPLDESKLRKLGSFVIGQGVQSGEFGIKGEALAGFLRERAGSEVTLIVVRETPELETNGLVHGFASRRHPTLRPPTLAIRVAKERD